MEIRTCKECGFILGTRPGLQDKDGVCLACLNKANKQKVNWKESQEWLTDYIAKHKNLNVKWECVVV